MKINLIDCPKCKQRSLIPVEPGNTRAEKKRAEKFYAKAAKKYHAVIVPAQSATDCCPKCGEPSHFAGKFETQSLDAVMQDAEKALEHQPYDPLAANPRGRK